MKNTIKKLTLFGLISSASLYSASAETNSSTRMFDNFNDNNIDPFEVCTTKSPNTVQVVSKRIKTVWKESGYDGGRVSRGAEACAELQITGKGRFEFKFNLPSSGSGSNGQPRYPSNKDAAIAQIFQSGTQCNGSWALLVKVLNGDLYIDHRAGCVTPTSRLIVRNIKRNKNHKIKIEFDPSRNKTGSVRVWFNDASIFHDKNINFGFAVSSQWSGDNLANGSYLTGKIGQYNYDSDNYNNGGIRTVYYDNVEWEKR